MTAIEDLLQIMRDLRDPQHGCPWDIRQTSQSIAPHTLDETHELIDAIERGDSDHVREELGDLLFNIVFHARIAEEEGRFDFDDVAQGIADKMRHRHPHVFGKLRGQTISDEVLSEQWQALKQQEKKASGASPAPADSDINSPFYRALHLQKKAAEYGFDWPDLNPVFDKLEEEVGEVREAYASGDRDAILDELGDVLFVCANIARHAKINAEMALRQTNLKFEKRFAYLQDRMAADGVEMTNAQLERMEEIWQESKRHVG